MKHFAFRKKETQSVLLRKKTEQEWGTDYYLSSIVKPLVICWSKEEAQQTQRAWNKKHPKEQIEIIRFERGQLVVIQ